MDIIKLPAPIKKGKISLEETINKRTSHRTFLDKQLTKQQISQLLWAGLGIVNGVAGATMSVPSAGAIYPLELLVVIGKNGVEDIPEGLYKYDHENNSIKRLKSGDLREKLTAACLYQEFISEAPVSIIIIGSYRKIQRYYGERGGLYLHYEVGHIGQNIHLQSEALGLKTVAIGAFHEREVNKLLALPTELNTFYIFPVGYPK